MRKKIAVMLSCLTVLSLCSVPDCTDILPDTPDSPVLEEPVETGGMIVGSEESAGISLLTRKLAQAEYEEYGVAATAETAYTITATVLPADATNKKIDWSISFVDPSSDWAQGKLVEDYVSLSFLDTQATLSCLAAFGEQIQITASSMEDSTVSASCLVDYAQKINSAYLDFGTQRINLGGVTEIKFCVSKQWDGKGGATSAGFDIGNVFTIADDFNCIVTILPCSLGALTLDGKSVLGMTWTSLQGSELDISDGGYVYGTNIFFDYLNEVSNWSIKDLSGVTSLSTFSEAALLNLFNEITCPWLFTVQLDLVGTYSSYTYSSDLKCVGAHNGMYV